MKLTRLAIAIAILLVTLLAACTEVSDRPAATPPATQGRRDETDSYVRERRRMVEQHLTTRDIVNSRVLEAMGRVPRQDFIPAALRHRAYQDSPLPIGEGQTISQPYIVALMTQLVDPQPHHKALDIGTGSGYQAAVLAELVEHVFSIEIVETLASDARKRLRAMGYKDVSVRHGDGYHGWASEAPFDIIIVAAAPDHIPNTLVEQLAPGGKMVIPVGEFHQYLLLIEKKPDGSVTESEVTPVRFVPMTGAASDKRE